MSSDISLWATVSVADHCRKRPFIADVLLYDRLVVPTPDGDSERERWRELGRDPDRQQELLTIMGDLAIRVPWSLERQGQWARRYENVTAAADIAAAVRDDVAQAVAFDMSNVAAARRDAARAESNQHAAGLDDPAFLMTRLVLADEFGSRKDRAFAAGIPRVDEVETVVAYGSYRDFRSDRGALTDEAVPGSTPVFNFGWSFFVPESSKRTDDDLLREAVDLAQSDEIVAWRAAVQRWRRDSVMKGESDGEAMQQLEGHIAEYREAARKRKIHVRSRWGIAVATVLAESAAVFIPPVGIPAAVFGMGALIPSRDIPKRLEVAAMFHNARRRFG